ncbi:MAG: restriction endonuclease [Gammaproteobacteria bacterium]|nr:restriction endonuclease [Gammaproteobacteria bacterium]MDH5801955.1 restriction endonuclease [Gammaproteobacteria bacterium]
MKTELPKFHETFIPILDILSTGEVMHYNELRKRVRDKFYSHLPEEVLSQKTQSGDLLILNRIGWGKAYLKEGNFLIQPERAMVKITEKGMATLKNGVLTLKQLKNDPDYVECQKNKDKNKPVSVDEQQLENATPQDLIDQGFSIIENEIKSELLEKFKAIDPYYFEKVILILLKKMGYGDFVETKKSGDGGIDGIINQDQLGLEKIFIQAKRYSENKVREKEIRNFIGAMSGDTTKGVFVTTSSFDESAVKKAKEAHHKIILIDGKKLVNLMYQFGVGVQTANIYEIKEIDNDFFEEN